MTSLLRIAVVLFVYLLPVLSYSAIGSGKDTEAKDDFVLDFNSVSNGLVAVGDFKQARALSESQYEGALATATKDSHELWAAVNMYSLVLKLTETRKDARVGLKKVIADLEAKFGKNVYSLTYVLVALGSLQNGEEQVASFQRALQIQRTVYPGDLTNYGGLARGIGFSYTYDTKRYGHALQMFGVALPVYEAEFGKDSLEAMYIHLAQARAYGGFEALELASTTNSKAFAIAQLLGDSELQADVWLQAGRGLAFVSDPTEALEHFNLALNRFKELFGTEHVKIADTRVAIAETLIFAQTPNDAPDHLLRALQFFENETQYFDRERHTLVQLVEAYEDMGQRDEATKYCLAISRMTPWKETNDYQPILKRAPEYPKGASARKEDGYVVVEYTVDENGFVQDPEIVESSAPESFYDTSIKASYGFRYAPRLENGEPVATTGVRNKFTYRLAE